ncbi:ankyrin repeat-containing protein BDA1 isoform X2 [Gossypium raimondii]|uniref:ankyrin repeat-containing protein BDA1 isoform X2 n=1 Tax=Gossypium raimondii TaxID=29730 RepID=UPI00227CE4E4|nr:ankyrin repeat-containing protein BDA1 isoform X2 [Gossypium raimondii]
MDTRLKRAARAGNVSDLYSIIERDGNVLKNLDEVEFVNTPLHIAAENGCTEFAMEILSLKPSFARKLHRGLSPIHLAVQAGHKEMVLRFIEIDKDLVRIRGKSGETPLHYISRLGNYDGLLDKILETCPDCIRDVTTINSTALHIATESNRLDVLQVLIRTLKKKDYCREVVNGKDKDGNTALHIAARNNQPEMLKLLLNCKADKYDTNQHGLTALEVAQEHNSRESITILRGCFFPVFSNFNHKMEKQIMASATKASLLIFHDMDNISDQDRNALLVILGLLLTTTYQASLSPPGGVWQGDSPSEPFHHRPLEERDSPGSIGTSVLALEVLLAFLAMCFDQSLSSIAPTFSIAVTLRIFSTIIFILMVFVCIAYHQVSKLSVSIVGCWIFPSYSLSLFAGEKVVAVIQVFLLFLVLYDEFWKGTILAVGYSLFVRIDAIADHGGGYSSYGWGYPAVFIGCWFFFNLSQVCIKRCIRCCKK